MDRVSFQNRVYVVNRAFSQTQQSPKDLILKQIEVAGDLTRIRANMYNHNIETPVVRKEAT